MKMLILLLSLYSLSASATVTEISDEEIHKQHMSVIKDIEVENQLHQNDVFSDCRKQNEFKVEDNQTAKNKKVKDAIDCFKKNIPQDSESLKKLSDTLELQTYGLVNNKDSSTIVNYLTKKIDKSLTGIDPDEANQAKRMEDLKFGKRKIVDQKVFMDLYTNHLMKSALLEVSRYCFENLKIRNQLRAGKSIEEYWTTMPKTPQIDPVTNQTVKDKKGNVVQVADITKLTDDGGPDDSYLNMSQVSDLTKKDQTYKAIIEGIGKTNISTTFHQNFHPYCRSAIKLFCDDFRKTTTISNNSMAVTRDSNSISTTMGIGQNSCLTFDRLTSIKDALKKSEVVTKQFEEMGEKKGDFALSLITKPQIYARGKGQGEESLDGISNMTSSDIMDQEDFSDIKNLEEKCALSPTDKECEQFLVKSDNLDKTISNIENQMNLKREIELARAKLLQQKDQKSLVEYLEDQGLFDLSAKVKANGANSIDIEKELTKVYEARKIAAINAIKFKVGKRQISEKTLGDIESNNPNEKSNLINQNIKDVKEEKIRMAQVIMFNNIITSTLELQRMDENNKLSSAGRNVGGWKKEFEGLQQENGINLNLFDGIKSEAEKNGTESDDTNIVGGGIIDSILGKIGD